MRRIAITGVSGYIGSLLAQRLAEHPDVEAIIGVDHKPPLYATPPKLRFHLRDVARPFDDLFAAERVDTALHLAFVVNPTRNQNDTRKVNIDGTRNFLQACLKAPVSHAVYLGSAAAYGAHPDNPVWIYENAPLRPNLGFQYSVDKASTDQLWQEFAVTNQGLAVSIIRGAVVLGPKGDGAVGAKVFQPVMIKVAGHDPLMQYLHEDDLVSMLVTAVEKRTPGIFNAAADGTLRYSEIAQKAGRKMLPIPQSVLSGVMNISWALHLQSQSTSPGLNFIAYPWTVANEKFKRVAGFEYKYSTEETLQAFLKRRQR